MRIEYKKPIIETIMEARWMALNDLREIDAIYITKLETVELNRHLSTLSVPRASDKPFVDGDTVMGVNIITEEA